MYLYHYTNTINIPYFQNGGKTGVEFLPIVSEIMNFNFKRGRVEVFLLMSMFYLTKYNFPFPLKQEDSPKIELKNNCIIWITTYMDTFSLLLFLIHQLLQM